MKKNLWGLCMLIILSCNAGTQPHEQKMLDCWSKTWVNRGDSSTYIQKKGVELVEKYLIDNGYLKGTEASDYMAFVHDSQQVVIPESVPDFNTIQLAFEGGFTGAPDATAMGGCFENNIPDKKDSTDALYRLADIIIKMKDAGVIVSPIFELYSTFTTKEFNRPFIKVFFYMNMINTKISLRKRYVPIEITLPDNY